MKFFNFVLYLFLISFTFCETVDNKENLQQNNQLESNYFLKLKQKVDCLGCKPTQEELIEYFNWHIALETQNNFISGKFQKQYSRSSYICDPKELPKRWYCPGYYPNQKPTVARGYQPGTIPMYQRPR
jgi:hypothetical protein